jgi:hypothetical protein
VKRDSCKMKVRQKVVSLQQQQQQQFIPLQRLTYVQRVELHLIAKLIIINCIISFIISTLLPRISRKSSIYNLRYVASHVNSIAISSSLSSPSSLSALGYQQLNFFYVYLHVYFLLSPFRRVLSTN